MKELTEIRSEVIEGFTDWVWPIIDKRAGDGGAWLGPKIDWENSHKDKYFPSVTSFDNCIQAGGNCGMYANIFSKFFKNVYTFEPDPLNFYCLVNNCKSPNIHKFNCALGSKHHFVNLNNASVNVGCHHILGDGPIPVLMIDDFEFDSLGFIQLDVEGYEFEILKGAVKTINKLNPVIVCERPSNECVVLLEGLGYKVESSSVSDTIFSKRV